MEIIIYSVQNVTDKFKHGAHRTNLKKKYSVKINLCQCIVWNSLAMSIHK